MQKTSRAIIALSTPLDLVAEIDALAAAEDRTRSSTAVRLIREALAARSRQQTTA